MPAGRPTKYAPKFCDGVREFLKDGYSLAAYAGEIGVSYSTVRLWEHENPEFSAAVKDGRAGAVLWWEKRNRELALGTSQANATSVIFGLKNRAPEEWRDKTEHELSGGLAITKIESVIVDGPANPNRAGVPPAP